MGFAMSAGHKHPTTIGSAEVDKALDDPTVKANLAKSYRIDRSYDLPYLAGYSRDGATIYIDRHLPVYLPLGSHGIYAAPFLEEHEHVEKAIIDALHWKYAAAHEVATAAERRKVISAGLNWTAYSNALKPYIKADEVEKLTSVPPDLDLTPYRGETKLLARIKSAQIVL